MPKGTPGGPCPRCQGSSGEPKVPRWGYCRPCRNEYRREWKSRQPKKGRRRKLSRSPREKYPVGLDRWGRTPGSVVVRWWNTPQLLPLVTPPRAEKRCVRCGATKPLDEFVRHAGKSDGRSSYCKPCAYTRNRPYAQSHKARRRALERLADAEFVDRFKVWGREGGVCHICRKAVPRDAFHLEHLVPLSKGGAHSYENVAVAHPDCNMHKHARVVEVQLRLGFA